MAKHESLVQESARSQPAPSVVSARTFAPRKLRLVQQTAALASLILWGYGCKSDVTDSRASQLGSQSIVQTVKDSTDGEIITHNDQSSNSRIAQVQIPMGALAVGQKISVEPSYHTDPADLKAEFGIDGSTNIKETQIATVVTSNMDKNLQQPMVIALDLPAASSSLLNLIWDSRHFFVVYTVRDAEQDLWKRGIMPDEALAIKDNRVVFSSQLLGRFEIFESSAPIEAKASEKATSAPDFSNPPVVITKVTPIIAETGSYVTVKGKYFTENTIVKVDGQVVQDPKFYHDSKMIGFIFPAASFGPKDIEVVEGSSTSTAKIIAKAGRVQPIIDAPTAEVCQGTQYIDLAGIPHQGTKACTLPACDQDNQIGCNATASYPAIASSTIDYSKVFTTVTVQGQRGQFTPPSFTEACSASGESQCQVTGNFIALKQGQLNSYNVRRGVVIPNAGLGSTHVQGNYPNSQAKLPRASYVPTLTQAGFTAAVVSNNQQFEYWDKYGTKYTFVSEGSLKPEHIRLGAKIYGIDGAQSQGTPSLCQTNVQVDCQISDGFVAVAADLLQPGNLQKGFQINGVTGDFPSDTYPLATVANETVLKASTFDDAITSNNAFVYFDSAGNKHYAQGSDSLTGDTIKNGVTLFGKAGKLHDFDTNLLKPENIRIGRTIAGVAGTLKDNCRNQAKTSFYNYTGTGGTSGVDYLDTIMDSRMPTDNPWPEQNRYRCDESTWEDLTVINGVKGCSSLSYNCVFRDTVSRRYWAGISSNSTENWSSAQSRCASATYGGFTDWVLPSHDELMQAYIHGMPLLSKIAPSVTLFTKNFPWWSRSRPKNTTLLYFSFRFDTGFSAQSTESSILKAMCVRQATP